MLLKVTTLIIVQRDQIRGNVKCLHVLSFANLLVDLETDEIRRERLPTVGTLRSTARRYRMH